MISLSKNMRDAKAHVIIVKNIPNALNNDDPNKVGRRVLVIDKMDSFEGGPNIPSNQETMVDVNKFSMHVRYWYGCSLKNQ